MENCVFCKIAKGEFDCAKVYEDKDVLAFLDVNPLTRGHCLVIPKNHVENIFDIDKEMLQKIIGVAKDISGKIKDSLQADGIRLVQSNGVAAGQEVMHFHLHLIARYKGDGLSMVNVGREHPEKADGQELTEIAEKLQG